MSFRTNRKTRQVFPLAQDGSIQSDKYQVEEPEPQMEEIENTPIGSCGGCGKEMFSNSQRYLIDNVAVCQECSRLDKRIERQERLKQPQIQINVGSSDNDKCSKCGMYLEPGKHGLHYQQYHGELA